MIEDMHGSGGNQTEAEAADWFVRLQADDLADHELAAFEAWLNSAPGAAAAFERLETLWLDVEAMAPTQAATAQPAAAIVTPLTRPTRRTGMRWPLPAGLALAASIAAALVLVPRSVPAPSPQVFEAARGQNLEVALADGTRVQLGGGSRLVVRLGRSERRVEMGAMDGEAAFDVAKDSSRPFVISAGDRSITVVGTEFDVRRAAGRLTVTVLRGIVQVASLSSDAPPVRLTAGEALTHREGEGTGQVQTVDPSEAFGWVKGERTYRDEPLPELAADLNRYFRTPLRVDKSAADLRFTGYLKIDEEDAVVSRLQAFLPIHAERTDKAIVLRRVPR